METIAYIIALVIVVLTIVIVLEIIRRILKTIVNGAVDLFFKPFKWVKRKLTKKD